MYDNLKEMPLYVYRPFYIVCMLNAYMFNVGFNASKRVTDVQNIFNVTRMESKSIAHIMQTMNYI